MRGQAAFEYLMIFSIILALVLILVIYSGQMTIQNQEDIRVSNAITAVNKIVEASNIVSTQGSPSQITLLIYFPEEIQNITFNGKTILIKVKLTSGIDDIFETSKSNLQGYISTSSGTKNIKVEAEGNYVNVTEG